MIVKDKRILATGYVGSPAGLPHCDEMGHDFRKVFDDVGNVTQHCVRTLHAEQNAIIQAAKFGVSIEGATLYSKMVPCRVCAMMIINSGIKRVVARKHYHAETDTLKMFKDANVGLLVISDELEKYDRQ